ncbi:MAG: Anti-sigma-K factor rskA [Phormidium sp. OSCR]|nr:MAG: Anti-sigma-K factor rskA [Phormidium sp. OSCR]
MSNLSPERLQELAAGYVLGDLSSEECQLFKTQLQLHPELAEDVRHLQDVLGAMPYGLPETPPPAGLRDRILMAAMTESSDDSVAQQGAVVPFKRPSQGFHWQRWASGVAAVLAAALLLDNLRLRDQLNYTQAQLQGQDSSEMLVAPLDAVLVSQWDGLNEITEDHLNALTRSEGPMDYNADDLTSIIERFDNQFTFSETNPVIQKPGIELKGGTLCVFGKIYGMRYTYTTETGQTLSFYQIDTREENLALPDLGTGKVYVSQPGKPRMVLWAEDDYVYAIVAELPANDLRSLSANIVRQ